MKTVYIHTINGLPAHYDGRQVIQQAYGETTRAVDSLKTIREQQRLGIRYRRTHGLDLHSHYDYRRISLP